jgi:putative membrane protein
MAQNREMYCAAAAGTFKPFGHGHSLPKPALLQRGGNFGFLGHFHRKGYRTLGGPVMKDKLLGAASALFLMTGSAFAAPAVRPAHQSPRPGTASEILSAVKDSTAGMVGELSAEITRSTQGFVTAVAINDMYEVAAGKIALERAQSPEVRAFAGKMVEAHTGTTARLKNTIRNNNVNVTFPDRVDPRRRGMLDELHGAKPQAFDHRYLAQQIAAHKEADILIHRYAKVGKINAVKDFAAVTDRDVEMHLSVAQKLDAGIRNGSIR